MAQNYFITDKWVYAPAARRKAAKAMLVLEHVRDFLLNTHDPADVWIDDGPVSDALVLLSGARKRVTDWEVEQHRIAKVAKQSEPSVFQPEPKGA